MSEKFAWIVHTYSYAVPSILSLGLLEIYWLMESSCFLFSEKQPQPWPTKPWPKPSCSRSRLAWGTSPSNVISSVLVCRSRWASFVPENQITWILKMDIPTRDARQPTWTQLWTAHSRRAGGDAFRVLILVMVTDICRGQHVSEHWCPGLGKEELCEHYLLLHCWVLLETEHTELNSR